MDAYNFLTLSYADEVIGREQAALAGLIEKRPADLSADQVTAFLEGLPRRYLQLFERDAVYRHVREAADLVPGAVKAWIEPLGSGWALTVLTHDQPFLFDLIDQTVISEPDTIEIVGVFEFLYL